MADWSNIKDVRLYLDDPGGFIDLISVANAAALPAAPAQQTCYYQADTGAYKATTKTSGAASADYALQHLRISDSRIGSLIDELGVEKAKCRAVSWVMTKLGKEMQLASASMGGDVSTYTSLRDMMAFYKGLQRQCADDLASDTDNSTGRVGRMTTPEIAGGLL